MIAFKSRNHLTGTLCFEHIVQSGQRSIEDTPWGLRHKFSMQATRPV